MFDVQNKRKKIRSQKCFFPVQTHQYNKNEEFELSNIVISVESVMNLHILLQLLYI